MIMLIRNKDTDVLKVIHNGKLKGYIHNYKYITNRSRIHYVMKHLSFGISKEIFEEIKNKVNEIVIIYTKEDGNQEILKSKIGFWETRGIIDKLGNFETQIFLPLKFFKNWKNVYNDITKGEKYGSEKGRNNEL